MHEQGLPGLPESDSERSEDEDVAETLKDRSPPRTFSVLSPAVSAAVRSPVPSKDAVPCTSLPPKETTVPTQQTCPPNTAKLPPKAAAVLEDQQTIPDLSDERAPRPQPGELLITPEAMRSRAKRIFTPRANGMLKVSQTIFDEWQRKGSKERKNLEEIFKACGYNPDRGLITL